MAVDLATLPKTQLARRIAEELGAVHPLPRHQIRQIVLSCSKRYAVKLLRRTQAIEAQGGWDQCSPSEVYLRLHQCYQQTKPTSE